jgi:CRP/FNR family transcriptional regulator, anaerobic regulatory protein
MACFPWLNRLVESLPFDCHLTRTYPLPDRKKATARFDMLETSCELCPLRKLRIFREFTTEELRFVSKFKAGELRLRPGETLLDDGEENEHLFTLLQGWMFRHKSLPDGRRQILNYAMPGGFIGLQASVFGEMQHTVEALTDVTLCIFPRKKIWDLYETQPGLGFDVTWLTAREEKMLDDHLLSVGRRSALERMAYVLVHLYKRAEALELLRSETLNLPITQQHVADTLGLSLVHTNKTLRKLHVLGHIEWRDGMLKISDMNALIRIARFEDAEGQKRPLI